MNYEKRQANKQVSDLKQTDKVRVYIGNFLNKKSEPVWSDEVYQVQNVRSNKVKLYGIDKYFLRQNLLTIPFSSTSTPPNVIRQTPKYVNQIYPFTNIKDLEKKLVKYYCFFETSEEFFKSQHKNKIVSESIEMNLHFHLFITSTDSNIYVPQLINNIILEFFGQRNKQSSLLKIDYNRIEKLEDDFILYHTKQMMYESNLDFIIKNI